MNTRSQSRRPFRRCKDKEISKPKQEKVKYVNKKRQERLLAYSKLMAIVKKRIKSMEMRKDLKATACLTRTVEMSSAHEVGDKRGKLLFVLAIGLTPKIDKPKPSLQYPVVKLERLDPLLLSTMRRGTIKITESHTKNCQNHARPAPPANSPVKGVLQRQKQNSRALRNRGYQRPFSHSPPLPKKKKSSHPKRKPLNTRNPTRLVDVDSSNIEKDKGNCRGTKKLNFFKNWTSHSITTKIMSWLNPLRSAKENV